MLLQMPELTTVWTTAMEGEAEVQAGCDPWLEAVQAVRLRVASKAAVVAEAVRLRVASKAAVVAEAVTAGWGGLLKVLAEVAGNNTLL